MKTKHVYLLMIVVVLLSVISLTGCSSSVTESDPIATHDQQTDVSVPVLEKEDSESDELVLGEVSEDYPDLEPESQFQEVEAMPENTAYPEPESDEGSVIEDENSLDEAYPVPVPQEEPIQVIKPTPRGNELVATNPSTVNLSSGKLQLVELFAFW